ncbi:MULTISPECIES: CC0125/CC1285 family lipoprotein [unclassified Arsukibacterium]|uniref:CC0125/CC1285 family lipoprotein n=1 Tax=unclassified Arsukibacterium TaxID=2635278 RepID=UPI000C3A4368|nr:MULTISPECIES: hypothetical protein [unclassified Arsukibacterium]MAA95922.1 hypothetical protein [Rheinheimera sp.]MBM34774.1 hypothetical protein [Rheinheimera sp.]HAW91642.1 hypothetical protein [Candidatus Azambacteria bacterium]|tara:strand:- start:32142 stop:32624 length:483 start_codon:yes stop_codon:yes gene_type:complete
MKQLMSVLMIFTALLLSACSSQPDYRAARGSGYGYSEQQINDNYYRVVFKARGDDSGKAKAYALRRAAELTAEQGYDWFVVVDKETMTERQRDSDNRLGASYQTTTVQDCGLLGCRSRTVQQPSYEMGLAANTHDQVESVLEIRMGKGIMPAGANSYPAR